MFLPLKISLTISDTILAAIFGHKYERLKGNVLSIYDFVSNLESNRENSSNFTSARMDRNEEKIIALQNQIVSLQRQVDQLQESTAKTKSASIPPPPPPPPPPPSPFCGPAPHMISKTGGADKVILKATRSLTPKRVAQPLDPKRAKPTSDDLIKGKGQLRETKVRRSPGGTPLTHWKIVDIDLSSPEDDSLGSVMKKALKRKFKNVRPFSPPSPIMSEEDNSDFSA